MVHDESGLYGLAQAHLVGQQDARRIATSHFMGNEQLVGNQACPCAAKPLHRGLFQFTQLKQRPIAQLKNRRRVNLPREQPVLWFVKLHEVV